MSMQDEINTMLARILDISADTAQIQHHLDNLLADPTPFLKEESDALIKVIKERLAQQQELINESADLFASFLAIAFEHSIDK